MRAILLISFREVKGPNFSVADTVGCLPGSCFRFPTLLSSPGFGCQLKGCILFGNLDST